jgi:hypothetical protein
MTFASVILAVTVTGVEVFAGMRFGDTVVIIIVGAASTTGRLALFSKQAITKAHISNPLTRHRAATHRV